MRASLRTLVLILFVAGLGARDVLASERSTLLVARGQVAYAAGRFDEARSRFAEAVAQDPDDLDARYALGLALGKLGRWPEARDTFADVVRRSPGFAAAEEARNLAAAHVEAGTAGEGEEAAAPPPRAWGISGGAGMEYDSNVALSPNHAEASGAGLFTAGAFWEPLRRPQLRLRLDWNLYQTVRTNLRDFDVGWNDVAATASWSPHRAVWLGTQGGWDHYSLGGTAWLQEPWVKPFVNVVEGEVGQAYVSYRFGWADWRSYPFHDVRTGPTDAVAVTQVFWLGDPSRWLTVGWQWDDERPLRTAGDDYRRNGNQALVALGLPLPWRIAFDATFLYRADDYTEPNSFSPTHVRRADDHYEGIVTLRRPLTDWLAVALRWDGAWNPSNVSLFDYRRQIVGAALEVTY